MQQFGGYDICANLFKKIKTKCGTIFKKLKLLCNTEDCIIRYIFKYGELSLR
jgi:hypothetical protein